jgi:hypothetical protein
VSRLFQPTRAIALGSWCARVCYLQRIQLIEDVTQIHDRIHPVCVYLDYNHASRFDPQRYNEAMASFSP